VGWGNRIPQIHPESRRDGARLLFMQDPIVEKPEAWPWSSFLHHATGVEGTVEIESFWTGARRDGLRDPRSDNPDPGVPREPLIKSMF
jgi:hypothetical protein